MFIDKTKKSAIGNMGVPHLHGHTKVTLTDAKTGEIEVYEKDNMVTDAVDTLYSKNLYGVIDYRDLKPVKDLFGGVMLFDAELDTDSIAPERTARVVANAGQTAHASASTKRGNPNNASGGSQELSNGYKYVWDWATNQGNGTIYSMSLCHKNCGDVSVSPDVFVSDIPLIGLTGMKNVVSADGTNTGRTPHETRYIDMFYLHPSGDWGYHSYGTTITKVKTCAVEQKINGLLGAAEADETKTFTISNFTAGRDSVTYDIENDKILFIVLLDTVGGTSVVVHSVDFDTEEDTVTTFNQGLTSLYTDVPTGTTTTDTLHVMSCNKIVKSGKYIFVPSSLRGFYRLNMTNTSDIVEVTSSLTSDVDLFTLGQVNVNEGIVLGYNYIIMNDTVYLIATFDYSIMWSGQSLISRQTVRVVRSEQCDVANLAWFNAQIGGSSSQTQTYYLAVALILPYVATIQQDFANPIVKTSDKTMKVEYTITNSSN